MSGLDIPERAREAALDALEGAPMPFATRESAAVYGAGMGVAVTSPIVVAAELRRLAIELGELRREVRQDADAVATGRAIGLSDAADVLRLRADTLDPEGATP